MAIAEEPDAEAAAAGMHILPTRVWRFADRSTCKCQHGLLAKDLPEYREHHLGLWNK